MQLRFVTVIIGLLYCICAGARQLPDTLLVSGAVTEGLSPHYSYYEDSSRRMDMQEIVALWKGGQFRRNEGKAHAFNSGPTHSDYWFVLSVHNDTTAILPLVWCLYNNNLDYVFYDITDIKHPQLLEEIVSSRILSSRHFKARMPALRFDLSPGETKVILLRVRKCNSTIVYFPSALHTTDSLLDSEAAHTFTIGRYIGYFMFVIIFNLFFGVFLRKEIHFWHGLYVLTLLLYFSSEYMFDVLYFPDWLYPTLNKMSRSVLSGLIVVLGLKVMQLYTEQGKNFPRFNFLNWLRKVVLFVCVLFAILSVALPPDNKYVGYLRTIDEMAILIGVVAYVTYVVYGCIRRNIHCWLYLLACALVLLSYVDYITVSLWNVRILWLPPGNVINGLTVEVTILTMYFVVNIFNGRKKANLELQSSTAENKKLSNMLLNAQEEERNRLAAEIHDGLGPSLGTLKLLISDSNADNKERLLTISEHVMDEVRNLSHALAATTMVGNGLYGSLESLNSTLRHQSQTVFNFVLIGDDSYISPLVTIQVYRIVNEAVHNVLKHAVASKAEVQSIIENEGMQLIIEDNGVGITSSENALTSGIGLKNIKTRVEFLKGSMYMDSNGAGTTIIIHIPSNSLTI